MKYKPVDYFTFGKYLLNKNDLDPVYVGLVGLELPPGQLASWLLSYWCFYHVGVSCLLTESHDYWGDVEKYAGMKAAPRGIERRHFRGQAAVDAVYYLSQRYKSPLHAMEDLKTEGGDTFKTVSFSVQQWPLFGPWVAFKVADMIDRCTTTKVDFSNCELSMYKEPVAGAKLIAQQERWETDLQGVCKILEKKFDSYLAPPKYERQVGLQEIETILCKYKSHYNGHYPLGKDTHELHNTLSGEWGPLAKKMKEYLPTYV